MAKSQFPPSHPSQTPPHHHPNPPLRPSPLPELPIRPQPFFNNRRLLHQNLDPLNLLLQPSSSTSSASSSSSTSFAASSSSVFNGDSQNRFAKEEDLYGADQHLVNRNAFFGGEIETKSYLASLNSSSIFFFFFVPVRSDNGSSEGGSSGNALPVKGFDVNRMPKPLLEMMPAARQRKRGRRG